MALEGGQHEYDAEGTAPRPARGSRRRLVIALCVAATVLLILVSAFPSFPVSAQVGAAVVFRSSVSPTIARQNETIRVSMSDTNLFPFANAPSDDAGYRALNLTGEPCGETYPMGVALYQGLYTLQNLSSAHYLPVVDEFTFWSCPAMSGLPFKLAPFWTDAQSLNLLGYWTAGETLHPGGGVSLGVLHPFTPGVYTLICGDAWGHVQVLYFQVTVA